MNDVQAFVDSLELLPLRHANVDDWCRAFAVQAITAWIARAPVASEPVAWLHCDKPHRDAITAYQKEMGGYEAYTIPCYAYPLVQPTALDTKVEGLNIFEWRDKHDALLSETGRTAKLTPVQPREPDAVRYRWLCKEVEHGSWSIAQHTVIDTFGCTRDTFMDDKAHADATIDAFMQPNAQTSAAAPPAESTRPLP